jgi:hypothetical protein
VQIGYRRAGWYGYDWIDNDGIRSAEQILPEWQHLKTGGTVPIWRGVDFRVTAIEPDKYFVFASESGTDSMAIGLYPLDEDHTRLVWGDPSWPLQLEVAMDRGTIVCGRNGFYCGAAELVGNQGTSERRCA